MVCDRCRKFVSMSEIRFQMKDEGRVALCSNCRDNAKMSELKPRPKPEEKKPFFCERCKYKFKHDTESGKALRCPYCGKPDKVIEDNVSQAEDIIRESTGYDH